MEESNLFSGESNLFEPDWPADIRRSDSDFGEYFDLTRGGDYTPVGGDLADLFPGDSPPEAAAPLPPPPEPEPAPRGMSVSTLCLYVSNGTSQLFVCSACRFC